MKDAVGRTIGVIDENGVVVACSDVTKMGETRITVKEELSYVSDSVKYSGYTYRPLTPEKHSEYVVFVEGEDVMAEKFSLIIAISLNNIKSFHDDKYDKTSFIKNLIIDNVLPGDIYLKSRELHLSQDVDRIVFLIKVVSGSEASPYDVLLNMFPNSKDPPLRAIFEVEDAL